MSTSDNIRWFKEQFGAEISEAVKGTPFTLDMLTAIACQETGFIWGRLRTKGLSRDRILELSVGDTIGKRARTFPRNKAELLAAPKGAEMFKIARDALVDLGQFLHDFATTAANPDKFCHGFGIFQFDIQFFLGEPDYFLERRWAKFDATLGKAISELKSKMAAARVAGKTSLTDAEMVHVAIAYNQGHFDPAKGLKQGFQDSDKVFYGEHVDSFLRLAKSIQVPLGAPGPAEPGAAAGGLAPGAYKVHTQGGSLTLRNAPRIDPATEIGKIGNGAPVKVLDGTDTHGFVEVEAESGGVTKRGFAAARFLEPA